MPNRGSRDQCGEAEHSADHGRAAVEVACFAVGDAGYLPRNWPAPRAYGQAGQHGPQAVAPEVTELRPVSPATVPTVTGHR
jgi:hypothetical protein